MKRVTLIILMLVLFSTVLLTACSGGTAKPTTSPSPSDAPSGSDALNPGMPIVNSPISLKVFSYYPAAVNPDWGNIRLWKDYEKMSGIHIDWDLVPAANMTERLNLMLASGDYPEIIYGTGVSNLDLIKYGETKVFLPLNDLIDNHAPNLKKLLDENPSIRKSITMPDGNIYGLPTLFDPEFSSVLSGQKFWVKEDWLKQLGMKLPTTVDELYLLLKAIHENDLNKNGKQDETPIYFSGPQHLLSYLKGAWGLGNRGSKHYLVDVDQKTNQLRFIPTDPGYKEILEFMNKLFKENIFTKELFTITNEEFVARAGEGNIGTFVGIGPAAFNGTGYVGGEVLKGPHGDQMYSLVNPSVIANGAFVLTDKNKHPEASMRWADYFYSEEGVRMYFMGFEGDTYKVTEDGNYEYTDEIVKNPKGLNLNQAIGQYLVWPGLFYPSMVKQKTFKGTEGSVDAIAAAEKVKPYFPKETWADFSYTPEENDQITAYGTDIATYVMEMQAKFVSGEVPFTDWDKYVATLKKMGLDKYMEIYNLGYQRYQNN
ncbi:extracellular solute-binding protein [Paenibacillus eucommiae]|uniref:Aldouronate transport system substrate-binding protein n=1 Tax=Paenibacillus eucommiae TaxID=1355755 RepID=A0ABS4IVX0_9BACL|nr:extracellular solute-binding protein [Paenibacillus eucommiae]MBP1991733.1 putative aldouronate transport system substrate-binding protein [Paenibacillus eucommiae]